MTALGEALRDAPALVPAVRAWLRGLAGWIEPELLLQRRLADEVPAVAARRLRLFGDIESVVAAALERELGDRLAARLAASSLVAALDVAEDVAAAHMEQDGRALTEAEIDAILDAAIAYTEAGVAALRERR